jgi:hypothetical protein
VLLVLVLVLLLLLTSWVLDMPYGDLGAPAYSKFDVEPTNALLLLLLLLLLYA